MGVEAENSNNNQGSNPQIVQNFNTICNIYIFNNSAENLQEK